MTGGGQDADRRVPFVIGALVVLLAVIAAGTGAFRDFTDGVADGGELIVRVLIGALVGAALGALVVLLVRRLGAARAGALGLTTAGALVLVIVIVAALGATAGVATAPLGPATPSVNSFDEATAGPTTPPRIEVPPAEPVDNDVPAWVGTVLAVVGLILVFLLVLGISRTFTLPRLRLRGGFQWGNRRSVGVLQDDLDLDMAADSFDDSAGSLDDSDDPRAAIIAAYVRLLEGLEAAGCARLPFEAPEEHLRRSLRDLGVRPEHMTVVVDRFLVARFSTHPMTVADRDAVRDALRAAGAQLREVAARTGGGNHMSDAPRWLKTAAIASIVVLLTALAKPAVAGLLLRAVAVGVVVTTAIVVVVNALHGLAPADGVGRRLDPRPPADVPRDLATLADELRGIRRRDPLPVTVLRPLRSAFVQRLAAHHGLSIARPEQDEAIRATVSPLAYLLLQSTGPASESPVIPGSELPALIEEVERL